MADEGLPSPRRSAAGTIMADTVRELRAFETYHVQVMAVRESWQRSRRFKNVFLSEATRLEIALAAATGRAATLDTHVSELRAERDGAAAPSGDGSKPESRAVRVTRVPDGVVVAARDAGSGASPAP